MWNPLIWPYLSSTSIFPQHSSFSLTPSWMALNCQVRTVRTRCCYCFLPDLFDSNLDDNNGLGYLSSFFPVLTPIALSFLFSFLFLSLDLSYLISFPFFPILQFLDFHSQKWYEFPCLRWTLAKHAACPRRCSNSIPNSRKSSERILPCLRSQGGSISASQRGTSMRMLRAHTWNWSLITRLGTTFTFFYKSALSVHLALSSLHLEHDLSSGYSQSYLIFVN